MTAHAAIYAFLFAAFLYAGIEQARQRHKKQRRRTRHPLRQNPTKAQRDAVRRRDHGLCVYCPVPRPVHSRSKAHRRGPWTSCDDCAEYDHDIPVSRGGPTTVANLVLSCFACNREKGTMTGDEYRAYKATGRRPRERHGNGTPTGFRN